MTWVRLALLWFHQSLRRRLLLWLLPATLLAGLLASIATWLGTRAELEDLLHDQLRYIARHVDINENGAGQLTVPIAGKHHHHQEPEADPQDEILLQVWRQGRLLFSSGPDTSLPPPGGTGFHNFISQGETWESWTEQKGNDLVRIAKSEHARIWALEGLVIHLFWPVLTLFPVLAIVVWIGITYGLRPLDKLSAELATRHEESLQPLTITDVPEEMAPLVQSINGLMCRLDDAFAHQRQFVADASHELRTPLMALRLQLEQATQANSAEQRQQALNQLHAGIERATHLTRQLLTLARLEPEATHQERQTVNLTELCKSVIGEQIFMAEAREIDLGYVGENEVQTTGNLDMLRMLVSNLVDNAIRYIPSGGTIDVAAGVSAGTAWLRVSDNGPGIAPAERQEVLKRFYRGEQRTSTGSGLGLSIVKRIADQHNASLILAEGIDQRGLTVTVRFDDARLSGMD